MQNYEQTQVVEAPADDVFAWLCDVNNLPHYLPPVREASVEGESAPGTPGRRISMRVGIPDRYETEGEGYLDVDRDARRMEWGSEMGRDYSGWLAVEENADGASVVRVHLSFGPRSVEEQVQEESADDRNPLEESVSATLESIRRQIEEGSGKVEQPSPER